MLGHNMDKMPNAAFRGMSRFFKIMHFFFPFSNRLLKFGIKNGFTVVDYGCGPGLYVFKASELVGDTGTVFAVDIHELAIQEVEKIKAKYELKNVHAVISSESKDKIKSNSVDLIYALDMFHMVSDKQHLLQEFSRMLKKNGKLILEDGHNPRNITLKAVQADGGWDIIAENTKSIICSPK